MSASRINVIRWLTPSSHIQKTKAYQDVFLLLSLRESSNILFPHETPT